ncbi:hypothetical protein E2C01_066322 [Portunus trituberculatus]|uniref:Uncharacterized protein n=1 Tax=Portunus trituberculatus TaxID=210409 RepID=A0A5B7HQM3_PORTR|nr:hypothetical protein [Portunus trituberculatus]
MCPLRPGPDPVPRRPRPSLPPSTATTCVRYLALTPALRHAHAATHLAPLPAATERGGWG